jgi:DNA-binding NarL/FixJ family response regulator
MIKRIAVVGSDKQCLSAIRLQVLKFYSETICLEFEDGFDFIKYCLYSKYLPEIVFLEMFLFKIDGVALTDYLTEYLPNIRVVAVGDQLNSYAISHIAEVGAIGYICKLDVSSIFKIDVSNDNNNRLIRGSFQDVSTLSYTTHKGRHNHKNAIFAKYQITKREALFFSLNATGLEYSEIATLMFISRKTVDNLFNSVAKKIGVQNRHNLTLFCLRIGLAKFATLPPFTGPNLIFNT